MSNKLKINILLISIATIASNIETLEILSLFLGVIQVGYSLQTLVRLTTK